MVDAGGNTYDYTYNEYNKVTQVTLDTSSTSQASPVASCAPPAVPSPGGGCDLVLESDAYDPAGLLAAKTDTMGRITNYFYDHNQDLAEVQQQPSSGAGRMTTYTYDAAGNLASQTASALTTGSVTASTVIDYTHDAANRLTSQVVDPVPSGTSASGYVNRTTSYTYNADNHVTAKALTDGSVSQTTSYGYDTAGNLTSQTVQDGNTSLITTWTRDQRGLPLSMTDPRGNASGATAANYTTNYAYDQGGNLASVTGPPTGTQTYAAQSPATTRPVTSYGYDTFGDQAQVQNPDRNTSITSYDGDGRVTSVTAPAYTPPGSTTPINATTSYAYDGLGNLTQVTDPAGNVTKHAYDALGDLVSTTDPQLTGQSSPGVSAYTYDSAGEQLSATDPTGATTQATYDYFGDQITATDALNHTTSYAYDYLGDVTRLTSPAGVITSNTYDHVGELTSISNAYGNTTSYAYNDAGQLSQVTNPDLTSSSYGYDQARNLTSVKYYGYVAPPQTPPVLRTLAFGYDAAGNLNSATDGRGNSTTLGYDAANHLVKQVAPVSASASDTTSYGYDAAGNQTSVTDGNGNTTWTTYNGWNKPESVIQPPTPGYPSPAQGTWTTTYNADGQPVSQAEPGGVTVTNSYDQLGNLTGQSGAGADAPTSPRSFGYDLAGRMISASAPGGTDTFGYYANGQLSTAAGPSGTSSFTYNPDGQLVGRTDAAGSSSYSYDMAGRLATLADPATGSTASYSYTPNSQVSQISYGAGTDTRGYGYDQLGQLTSEKLTGPSGQAVASIAYGYDANGNETSKTTSGFAGSSANTYSYDEANRLTSWNNGTSVTSYAYDGAGNLTQNGPQALVYNARDQLTSSTVGSNPPATFSYTARGTLAANTSSLGTSSFTADAFGQPIKQGVQNYSYDALGRMIGDTGLSNSYTLAYSGRGRQIASDSKNTYSYDPTGQLTGIGVAGGTTGQGTLAYTDSHTDVVGGYAPAGTSLAGSTSYDPYGNPVASAGSMPTLGYQSDFTDHGNTLTDMGARWYWPAYGQFTTNDTSNGSPLPNSVSPNPYAYAGGNPLTVTDPTGHLACAIDPSACLTAISDQFTGSIDAAFWDIVGGLGTTIDEGAALADEFGPELINLDPYAWLFGAGLLSMMYNPVLSPSISCNTPGGAYCTSYAGWPGGAPSWDYGIYSAVPFGGYFGGVGGALCNAYCYPPPPPPPPQDIYAGPNAAAAPTAPHWLRYNPYTTRAVHDVTSPSRLPRAAPRVIEKAPPNNQAVSGTHPQDKGGNGHKPAYYNMPQYLRGPIKNVPPDLNPAAPSPLAGSAGNGGGSRGPPRAPPGSPELGGPGGNEPDPFRGFGSWNLFNLGGAQGPVSEPPLGPPPNTTAGTGASTDIQQPVPEAEKLPQEPEPSPGATKGIKTLALSMRLIAQLLLGHPVLPAEGPVPPAWEIVVQQIESGEGGGGP
jgi:RHS repeat-associated protein